MERLPLALTMGLMLFASPALAKERAVTEDERAKLAAAMTAQGCSGGKMQFDVDHNHYEVDDAQCNDSRKYDLKFDVAFKMIKKDLEN